MKEIFEEVYAKKYWGPGSGRGSLPISTKGYVEFLEKFLAQREIQSIIDLGCGDWQFSRYVQWGTAQYRGFDVVSSVISNNQRNYASRNINFQLYSGNPDELPKADVLLAKDVLQHWSNQTIAAFLPVLARYRFALITNDVNPRGPTANIDIEDGGYRYLDLRLPPFQLSATEVYSFTSNDVGFFNQVVLGGLRSTLRWSVTGCRPSWIKRVLLVESNPIFTSGS